MNIMTRRGFLTLGGASALAMTALATAGCTSSSTDTTTGSAAAGSAATEAAADATTESAASTDALVVGSGVETQATDAKVSAYYEHVVSVTALAKTFAACEKIIGVAIEYDVEVDGSGIVLAEGMGSSGTYAVGTTRTITTAYTNDEPWVSENGGTSSGKYVIVEFDLTDNHARTILMHMSSGPGQDGPVLLNTDKIRICQTGDLTDVDGNTLAGDESGTRFLIASSRSNPQADGYILGEFDDEATGNHAAFALREPNDYDASESYPVVVHLPDNGVTSPDPTLDLRQGLGAVGWNDDGCFVVSVAGTTSDAETALNLVYALAEAGYSMDTNRIVGTGQSAGCMALIRYAAANPEGTGYSAMMLVGGQGEMTNMKNIRLYCMCSEDDFNSYSGMTNEETGIPSIGEPYVELQVDATYNYDGEGHTSGLWYDFEAAGDEEFANDSRRNQSGAKLADSTRTVDEVLAEMEESVSAAIEEADAAGTNIIFCHIKEGTLDCTDSSVAGGNSHNFTWQWGYQIPSARQWVLEATL